MTNDDLRTKIAVVLHSLYGVDLGYADHGWDQIDQAAYLADADVLIRELNLSIAAYYKTCQGREVCVEGYWTEESNDD